MKSKAHNLFYIYKIMFQNWFYLIGGIFFMLGYALFSGITITTVIPLFDYVFAPSKAPSIYNSVSGFFTVLKPILSDLLVNAKYLLFNFDASHLSEITNRAKYLLENTNSLLLLKLVAMGLIFLIVLKNIFFYGNQVFFANLRGKTTYHIRNQIFKKYLTQPLEFLNTNKVGDSMVRIVDDVKNVSDFYIQSIINAARDVIMLFVFARIAIMLNPKLFWLSLIILPLFGFAVRVLGKKIKKYSKKIQQQFSSLFSKIEEILNGIHIVQVFSREEIEMRKFNRINRKYFIFWRKSILYKKLNVPLSELNSLFIVIIVLLLGGMSVLASNSHFTLGMFTAFLLAIGSMLNPFKKLTATYANIKKAVVSLNRIFVILNRKSEIKNCENPIPKKSFDKGLVLKNVSFFYDEKVPVLQNISFQIKKGEKIAIVGGSGAGKTTIINLLPRMYDPTNGEIFIDDVPINKLELKDLRSLYGTVTQESILFSDTVANNIRFGSLQQVSDEKVIESAKIAYADNFIQKMPNKYDEILNPKATNLSGGQRQRICIARAIIGNPPILIFDEATSSLDTESEQKVQKAIERATENKTVIVIAHRLSTILSSDKIIVLDKGKLVGLGSNDELLKTCPKYKKLYDMQFEVRSKK